MARRIAGGIAGWLIGLLPLIAVNVAAYLGMFSGDDTLLVRELLPVVGLLLGGIVAGIVGSRPTATQLGGVTGAFYTGGIAALLYAVTAIGLIVGTTLLGVAPEAFVEQPIRIGAAALFLAALLAAIAVVTGAIASRAQGTAEQQQDVVPTRQPQPASHPRAKSVPLARQGGASDRGERVLPRGGQERRTRPLSDYQDPPPRTPPPTQPRYRDGQPERPGAGQWQQRDYPPRDDYRR